VCHLLRIGAFRDRFSSLGFQAIAALVSAILIGGPGALLARQEPPAQPPATQADAGQQPDEAPKLSPEQLEALVAPIALYPDNLLAQCLVASTYPIDVVQAQQWLDKHKDLKGDALSQEAMKQAWDPSVQALTGVPDALKVLAQDIKWTTDLGDAFLAQQSEVMDAAQRLRAKAKNGGKLDTTEQMKVETKVVEDKQVIVIEQSNPEVVYVPSYSPSVVFGVGYYPYPPLYYPPYYGGAWLGFGVGIAVGIGIAGGWGCGWGGNNTININNNNNFVNNSNRQNNVSNRSGNSNWQHNAQQRGGAPYKDKATANKVGANSQGRGGAGARDASRGGGAGVSSMDAGRGGGAGGGSSFGGGSGGGDRIGSRDMGGGDFGGGGRSSSGFSGSSSGSRGASASSSRGSSSFSGGSRGGGGYSGGSRGGGGGRRR
jgi:Protein of unknown function (DUF3300)